MISTLIAGGIILGSWAIALFFLRFWHRTRDRLFAWFALSFFLFGIERLVLAVGLKFQAETHSSIYLIRLVAFLLIVFAVINKNRAEKRR